MSRRRLLAIIFCIVVFAIFGYSCEQLKQANENYKVYQSEYRNLRTEFNKLKASRRDVVFLDDEYNEMVVKAQKLLRIEEDFTKLHADKGYSKMRNSNEYKNLQLELGKFFSSDEDKKLYKSPWNYDISWSGSIQIGSERNGKYDIMFIYSKRDTVMMIVSCRYSIEDRMFSEFKTYVTADGLNANFYGDSNND